MWGHWSTDWTCTHVCFSGTKQLRLVRIHSFSPVRLSPPHLARVTRPSGGGAAASEPRAGESACRAAQARRVRTRSRAGRRGAAGHERGLEQRGVAGHGDEAGRDRRSGARCGHAAMLVLPPPHTRCLGLPRRKPKPWIGLDCFFPVKWLASYSISEERGGAIPPIQTLKFVSFPLFFIPTNFLCYSFNPNTP